jgi:tRNA pseudouridine55 synthase
VSGGADGLLLVDKPSGPTSHDIVARVRRLCGTRRVGHAGTLDPLASGLLPIVLGRATRLVRFLPHSPKLYTGALRLGFSSTTDDVTGELTPLCDGPWPDPRTVQAEATSFLGQGLQIPPTVSARKIGGERMYRLARRGIDVSPAPAPVEISRFDVTPTSEADRYAFVTEVSRGTYVRALLRDLGARLGCGAVLAELRRERIGPLELEHAVSLPDPPSDALTDHILPLEAMPLEPPIVELADAAEVRRFCSGQLCRVEGTSDGPATVKSPEGRLLGIGETDGETLRPRVVVRPGS